MSSKSANYCASYTSNGQALLLLCEAELGNPTQKLTDASYSAGEDAKSQGMYSTWGQGTFGPPQWKDARCVHPSLSGISLVSFHLPLWPVLSNANIFFSPMSPRSHPPLMSPMRTCNTMSISLMMLLRSVSDIFSVFACRTASYGPYL